MRRERAVQSTTLNKTHLANRGSSNCLYIVCPQLCLLALEEQLLVTNAFHEQICEKCNQDMCPTQREPSAFSAEMFWCFLTVRVWTEGRWVQVIYIPRYIWDQLNGAYMSPSTELIIQDCLLCSINGISKHQCHWEMFLKANITNQPFPVWLIDAWQVQGVCI